MARLKEIILSLVIFGVITCSIATRPTKYVFVIFGDSFSDNGNTFRVAGVPDPAVYYKGRYSNGAIWTDYMKRAVKGLQIFNYAYGSATACASPFLEQNYPYVKNLTGQVADFLADVKSGKIPTGQNVKLIVLQVIGSNDLVFPLKAAVLQGGAPSATQLMAAAQAGVACRVAGIRALLSVPAVKHVVVFPLLPIHLGPSLPTALKPQVQALENAFDTATAAAVNTLQTQLDAAPPSTPGAGVKLYTMGTANTWVADLIAQLQPDFKVTDAPCVPISNPMVLIPNAKVCDKPNSYLWFDESHPSSRAHQWFATRGVLPQLRQMKLIPETL